MSELKSSMSQVQVEQKTYQMPPQDGFTVAYFLTVADIERSAPILRKGLRRSHSEPRRAKARRGTSRSRTRGSLSTSAAVRHPTNQR